jgi:hypothetical protein
MKTFSLDSWFPGQGFNPEPTHYEAGMLITAARHSL